MNYSAILLTTTLFLSSLQAKIIYVDDSRGGDGSTWSNATLTLQFALDQAVAGDEIWVAEGTYYPGPHLGTPTRNSTFQLKNGVTIRGGFTLGGSVQDPINNPTILSGNIAGANCYHVVTGTGTDSTAVLDGFIVRDGQADVEAGRHHLGGGLICDGSGSPTIRNVSFLSNYAGFVGGACYLNAAHPTFTNVKFQANSTKTFPVVGGRPIDGQGGAVYLNASNPQFTNCLFSGNFSGGWGGALSAHGSAPSLINCTMANNWARNFVGGLYNAGPHSITLKNSILWDNVPRVSSGSSAQYSGPVTGNNNLIQGYPADLFATGNDPLFIQEIDPFDSPSTAGDYRLNYTSTGIHAGNDADNSTTTDLLGNPRKDDMIDIGPYEGSPSAVVHNNEDAGNRSLRAAILRTAPGGTITFLSDVSGKTITLTQGQLTLSKDLTIDASSLPAGVTIDANGATTNHRVLQINSNRKVSLDSLTLRGGVINPAATQPGGGGILNQGDLTLNRCTVRNNSTNFFGGGIHNSGRDGARATLTLTNSTISDNTSGTYGGGIFNDATRNGNAILTCSNSSFFDNTAGLGAAICNDGRASGSASTTLIQSSVLNNFSSSGHGIYNLNGTIQAGQSPGLAYLYLTNSIIAENTASSSADIINSGGNIFLSGINFIGNNRNSGLAAVPGLIGTPAVQLSPNLAPRGNYGGLTETRPPYFDSPVVDPIGSTASGLATDQRGFARIFGNTVDLGAVEFGPDDSLRFNFEGDDDKDGYSNGLEAAIGSDVLVSDPNHPAKLALTPQSPNTLTFGYVRDEIPLKLTRSTDLINFDTIIDDTFTASQISLLQIQDGNPPAGGEAYYRLEAINPFQP